MALSYVTYTANGSTNQFDVTFSYIEQSHVKVYIDNVADNSFTWVNASRIQTSSTPSNGAVVKIDRDTPTDARLVDFVSGSVLSEADLDKSANQNFFSVQENVDAMSDKLGLDNSNLWDATSKRIINVANPTSDQDAVTKHFLENTWLSTTDKTNLTTVAGKSTELGRLGTADAVADMALLGTTDCIADMNTLGTSAVVEDLNILGTSDVVTDMNVLGTSSNVTNMNTLAGISSNITTVAGISSNVTTVAGISSDVTAVAGDATDIGAVAAKATEIGRLGTADAVADMALLGTSAVVADMALLADADVIADMALLADADVIADMNTLATSDIVSDLNTLATSDIVSDLNTLATSDIVSDINTLATSDIVSDLNTLATSDIVSDINTLATSDIVTDLNLLATSDFVSDLNTMATSDNVANLNTVADNIAGVNSFAERYRVASSDPASSNDAGDLAFNTSSNVLKYYNGSAWQTITADTDVKTKVSSNDTTAGFLNGKLVGGTNVTLTEGSDGGNETLTISASVTETDPSAIPFAIALS